MKLKTNKLFPKRSRKTIINQDNKDQIGKNNTINLNSRMKLKTNKAFSKKANEKKIRNQKNKD
jgi:hypothetical protein